MAGSVFFLAALAAVLVVVVVAQSNNPPVWPHPKSFTSGSTSVVVDSNNFVFDAATSSPDLLAAFTR